LGVPYVWAGEEAGVKYDCSGLTRDCYQAAGIDMPHNAQLQYEQGPIAFGAPQTGDLFFYGTRHNLHHVAIYAGGGKVIEAPHSGALVSLRDAYTYEGGGKRDYFGATRPCPVGAGVGAGSDAQAPTTPPKATTPKAPARDMTRKAIYHAGAWRWADTGKKVTGDDALVLIGGQWLSEHPGQNPKEGSTIMVPR